MLMLYVTADLTRSGGEPELTGDGGCLWVLAMEVKMTNPGGSGSRDEFGGPQPADDRDEFGGPRTG